MKKFLKWTAIGVGGLIVLVIVVNLTISDKDKAKFAEERRVKDSINAIETAKQDSINAIKNAEKADKDYEEDNMVLAFKAVKEHVTNNLKAPSTAKFIDDDAKFIRDGKKWSYTGRVDSQNSFGAMIRSTYIVVIEDTGGDKYDLSRFELIQIQIK